MIGGTAVLPTARQRSLVFQGNEDARRKPGGQVLIMQSILSGPFGGVAVDLHSKNVRQNPAMR
jgi:hypothetical protein